MKTLVLTLALAVAGSGAWAQEAGKKPDDTAVNKRDRDKTEKTADQQKENKSDRELAKEIRRAIVSDKSLSTYAHNVKVIVANGAVTLKGPVKTDEEKSAVVAKAKEAAGGAQITDELSVAGDTADRMKPSAMKDKQESDKKENK
jgi:osmotically-inducible protein OsmY